MKTKIFQLILSFLLASLTLAKAQGDKQLSLKQLEREKISDLFIKSLSRESFKDTNMIFMFAYKIDVRKNAEGKTKIWDITESDPIAKTLFKNTDFLKEINFGLFMGKSMRSTFVFPIVVLLSYPKGPNAGFVNMQDLQSKLENYWFRRNYTEEPVENYLYFPSLILRTSTISSD